MDGDGGVSKTAAKENYPYCPDYWFGCPTTKNGQRNDEYRPRYDSAIYWRDTTGKTYRNMAKGADFNGYPTGHKERCNKQKNLT